jgi:hypothetical protein
MDHEPAPTTRRNIDPSSMAQSVCASWDRDEQRLAASEDYCWYSWSLQAKSMGRLADYRFESVLPGHGQRVRLPAAEMRQQVERLAESMRERKKS